MVREMNGGREVEGEGGMQGVGREGGSCVRWGEGGLGLAAGEGEGPIPLAELMGRWG
jgi:hypothetical protein